jgi:hypothetical protein
LTTGQNLTTCQIFDHRSNFDHEGQSRFTPALRLLYAHLVPLVGDVSNGINGRRLLLACFAPADTVVQQPHFTPGLRLVYAWFTPAETPW